MSDDLILDFENELLIDADTAYIKKEVVNHEEVWSIYGADGMVVGQSPSSQMAMILANQYDLNAFIVQ